MQRKSRVLTTGVSGNSSGKLFKIIHTKYKATNFCFCFIHTHTHIQGLPKRLSGKESACQCRRRRFNLWIGKIPWRRAWEHIPVFLPEKSHGQRSLVGYSPWGHKEWDMTEQLNKLFLSPDLIVNSSFHSAMMRYPEFQRTHAPWLYHYKTHCESGMQKQVKIMTYKEKDPILSFCNSCTE